MFKQKNPATQTVNRKSLLDLNIPTKLQKSVADFSILAQATLERRYPNWLACRGFDKINAFPQLMDYKDELLLLRETFADNLIKIQMQELNENPQGIDMNQGFNNFLLDKVQMLPISQQVDENSKKIQMNTEEQMKGVSLRARAVSVDSDLLDQTTSLDRKANSALNGFFADFKFKAEQVEREAEKSSGLDSDSQLLGSYDLEKSVMDDIDVKELLFQDKLDKSEMIIRRVEELTKDPHTTIQHFEKILGLKLPIESVQEYKLIEELLYSYSNLETSATEIQNQENQQSDMVLEGNTINEQKIVLRNQYLDSKNKLEQTELILAYLDLGGEELEYLRIHNFFNKAKIIRNSNSRCFCVTTCRHCPLPRNSATFLFTLWNQQLQKTISNIG